MFSTYFNNDDDMINVDLNFKNAIGFCIILLSELKNEAIFAIFDFFKKCAL